MAKYQILSEFLANPFFTGNSVLNGDFENKYRTFKKNNRIKLKGVLEYKDSYFYHVEVPSESKDSVHYDVVVQFFTNESDIKKDLSVNNYFVKFFSNSPSFVYKYAHLYEQEGYLITELQHKFSDGGLTTPPDKNNKDKYLSYDKSIYYAVRYLTDNKFHIFSKLSIMMHTIKNVEKFFDNISDVEGKMIDLSMSDMTRTMDKTLKANSEKFRKLPEELPSSKKSKITSNGKKSTLIKIRPTAKKKSTKSTFK